MSNLTDAANIGKVLAEKLKEAGIESIESLKEVGSEKAFILLKNNDNGACINSFYALEGAIQGIRWHLISNERKRELKNIFDKLQ